jgi:glycine hydroxymethyltransferase
MHVIAAKAVSFKEAMEPSFKEYQNQIVKNAAALAEGLMEEGMQLVSGGTDNHLMLVDLRKQNVTGKDAEKLLDKVRITANKNTIPNDPQSPFVTSGIRLGTPAVTTRGMKEADMKQIAKAIRLAVEDFDNNKDKVLAIVDDLCTKYPLYPASVIR